MHYSAEFSRTLKSSILKQLSVNATVSRMADVLEHQAIEMWRGLISCRRIFGCDVELDHVVSGCSSGQILLDGEILLSGFKPPSGAGRASKSEKQYRPHLQEQRIKLWRLVEAPKLKVHMQPIFLIRSRLFLQSANMVVQFMKRIYRVRNTTPRRNQAALRYIGLWLLCTDQE
jgi:hypothetical protein